MEKLDIKKIIQRHTHQKGEDINCSYCGNSYLYRSIDYEMIQEEIDTALDRAEKEIERLKASNKGLEKLRRQDWKEIDDYEQLRAVLECAKRLSKAIDKSNNEPDLPNTSIVIQELNNDIKQAIAQVDKGESADIAHKEK